MPSANKGKGKGREARQSRSRNTTPSSGLSAGAPSVSEPPPSYLDNDVSKLFVPTAIQYAELLETVGGAGSIPDSKSLESLMEHLKTLSQLAETRGDACNAAMRELHQKRKDATEDEPFDRDGADRVKMKREADDDEDMSRASKGGRLKKRKERGTVKEERPPAHGAHEVSRQDGAETKVEGGESTLFMPRAVRRCRNANQS